MLDSAHDVLRWSHIVVGFIGLVVFWIPTLSKKGSRWHIRSGKVFVACGYFMVATAFVSCTWALISPSSFARFSDSLSPARVAELELEIRFFFVILLVLASWILMDLVMGVRVLRVKTEPDVLSRGSVRPTCWFTAAINLAAIAFGAAYLATDGSIGYLVPIVLGLIGCSQARGHLQFIANPRVTRMAWWYKHMECMLGTGVGFYTAFFVFGSSRLFGFSLSGWAAMIPWVLPGLIGGTTITIWVRYYKRRFGERDAKTIALLRGQDGDALQR